MKKGRFFKSILPLLLAFSMTLTTFAAELPQVPAGQTVEQDSVVDGAAAVTGADEEMPEGEQTSGDMDEAGKNIGGGEYGPDVG